MKVLFVTDKCDRPESELFIALSKKVKVTVMCNPDGRNYPLLKAAGVNLIDLKITGRFDKQGTEKIKQALYAGDYDLLHAFNSRAVTCAIKAGKKHRVKILGYRGVTTNMSYTQPENWFSFLHPCLDGVFCVAEAVRQAMLKARFLWLRIPPKKLKTIYKGHKPEWYTGEPADLARFNLPKNSQVLSCISRNSMHKGIPTLLEAFDSLPSELNAHLLLIGDIDKNQQAHQRASQCKHPERIHFTGYINNPTDVIRASDLLVSASKSGEGLPRVVVEAMCVETPVVATDAGGTPEIVLNNKTGLLVKQGNSEQLKEAIMQTFQNPDATQQRVATALKRINTVFDAETTAQRTLEWYKSLIA
ncbi:glycosyltransferase [Marinospirillum insulare]|uniref:Glycosyl transferase family 1 domain-containing protein n=1 Tax=Marinospirillum insulare TaxID=217169 RepID=A0ABQ6A2Q5_9GAMM|nr:glycosyltransferase [Marinospirillum insulare]GLR64370.1 hypothetical protein GCM10007878_18080 [Marinospirillum insulare]